MGSLGDTIVSIPAYRAVRAHFGPDARLIVLHNKPADVRAQPQDVLAGSGLVDGFIGFTQNNARSDLRTIVGLWPRLVMERFDAVAYLAPGQRTPAQVKRDDLFFKLCGIKKRLGMHACDPAMFNIRDPVTGRPSPVPHEAELRLDRLRRDGVAVDEAGVYRSPLITLSDEDRLSAYCWVAKRRTNPDALLAVLCPGANQSANFWPLNRFIELGKRLMDDVGYEIVVAGGPAEQLIAEKMINEWGAGINAAGIFTVAGSAAVLGLADLHIGLDTGTSHIAAALGVRSICIFGERNPEGQWAPLGKTATLVRFQVDCAGCGLRVCPKPDHPCMAGISVDDVWAAIVNMSAENAATPL
jgi:ADP-heptose:LPS heptosyltransferase